MLKKLSMVLAAVFLMAMAGCASDNPASASKTDVQFVDYFENTVSVKSRPERTVALQGSYAQLWLESGGELAGVTEDFLSNYPDVVTDKTSVMGSLKDPNLESILELEPDFVILSPDIAAQVKMGEPLDQAGIPHGYFKQESYQDYLDMFKIFTDINGQPKLYNEAEKLVTQQVSAVEERARNAEKSPKVLLVRGMSSGVQVLGAEHSTGKMLQTLHAENIADKYPSLLKELSPELVLDENPDYILVVPMGKVEAADASFWKMIQTNPLWQEVGAIKNNQVHLLPKELFQLKPNARWGESYEYLAEILYPK